MSKPAELPDRMTGTELITQEEHELGYERRNVDGMDRVDRRDLRGEIHTSPGSVRYAKGWERIWGK